MVALSFYIFSAFLSYTDCTRYRVPNIMLIALGVMLLVFGFFENRLTLFSFVIPLAILVFFIVVILLKRTMILGGGDIKYMMVVGFYLQPYLFPLFLLLAGIFQAIFLIYFQKIKKRRVAPMVPAMFLAAIFTEISFYLEIYPF